MRLNDALITSERYRGEPVSDDEGRTQWPVCVLWDDEIQGFGVRIFPPVRGRPSRKDFIVTWKVGLRTRTMAIGTVGVDCTLRQARRTAREALDLARRGQDPIEARQRALGIGTAEDLASRFLYEHTEAKKKPTAPADAPRGTAGAEASADGTAEAQALPATEAPADAAVEGVAPPPESPPPQAAPESAPTPDAAAMAAPQLVDAETPALPAAAAEEDAPPAALELEPEPASAAPEVESTEAPSSPALHSPPRLHPAPGRRHPEDRRSSPQDTAAAAGRRAEAWADQGTPAAGPGPALSDHRARRARIGDDHRRLPQCLGRDRPSRGG